ncbi:MAG: DUF3105 domain-containing protein [Actinobacteria bacterium]|nr:DUF3105 domain-containing protein [Actinomycetota bacterium]
MSKKLEEKQRRRQIQEERDAARRRAARKRNILTWGVVLVVMALVVLLIGMEKQRESGPVGVDDAAAGCNTIETPEDEGATHVDDGTPVTYGTSPPTSGDHWIDPAPSGFNPPSSLGEMPTERIVHNMEHGQVVIWYAPDAPSDVVDDLEGYFDNTSGAGALLVEPYEGIETPYNFTITAWGATQSCEEVSEDILDAFRERFQGKGPENVGIPTFTAEN